MSLFLISVEFIVLVEYHKNSVLLSTQTLHLNSWSTHLLSNGDLKPNLYALPQWRLVCLGTFCRMCEGYRSQICQLQLRRPSVLVGRCHQSIWSVRDITCWQQASGSSAWYQQVMVTSSNGTIFRVTGHSRHRWNPRTKASNAELWCFLWSAPE